MFSKLSLTAASAPEAGPYCSVLRRLAFPGAAPRTSLQCNCAVSSRGTVMAQRSMRLPANAQLAKSTHLRRQVQIPGLLVLLGWQRCNG